MTSILAVFAVFLPMWLLERVRPGRRWPSRPLWVARALAFNAAQVFMVMLATATWDRYMQAAGMGRTGMDSLVGGALLGYLVITFVYYWWHRARHASPFLWRTLHQLHHSPQRLELLTAFYKHPAEMLINGLLTSSILYLALGLTPAQAGLTVMLTGLAELVYHWNVRTPHWLGFLIQRPESHCVHHARGRHSGNYSDLPLWDMLFGTFNNPRATEFECGFGGNREFDVARMLLGRAPSTTGDRDAQ